MGYSYIIQPGQLFDKKPINPVPLSDVQQQYADFLISQNTELFFTGTFRGEYTEKSAFRALSRFFNKKRNEPEFAFLCVERGEKYDRIHTHGLLRYGPLMPRFLVMKEEWYKRFGRNKFEFIRSQKDVTAYVQKYITKDMQHESYLIAGTTMQTGERTIATVPADLPQNIETYATSLSLIKSNLKRMKIDV